MRPENSAPPEIYYNEDEARKYTDNSRIMEVQEQMAERALELLLLPEDEPKHLLDIGCGSGLSGSVLDEAGHSWVGIDISEPMLNVAVEREVKGELVLGDMGNGLPFEAGSFDGAISISALQWLCNADKKSHNPVQRLNRFFTSLFGCLKRSARAVFQFYPADDYQLDLITKQAMKAGFFGGVVVDYPNSTKAKKMYLVLMTSGNIPLPKGLDSEEAHVHNRQLKNKCDRRKPLKNSREWILEKKERRRKKNLDTRPDSKYTGRKRSGKF